VGPRGASIKKEDGTLLFRKGQIEGKEMSWREASPFLKGIAWIKEPPREIHIRWGGDQLLGKRIAQGQWGTESRSGARGSAERGGSTKKGTIRATNRGARKGEEKHRKGEKRPINSALPGDSMAQRKGGENDYDYEKSQRRREPWRPSRKLRSHVRRCKEGIPRGQRRETV